MDNMEEEEERDIETDAVGIKSSLYTLIVKQSKVGIALQWNMLLLTRIKRIKLLTFGRSVEPVICLIFLVIIMLRFIF